MARKEQILKNTTHYTINSVSIFTAATVTCPALSDWSWKHNRTHTFIVCVYISIAYLHTYTVHANTHTALTMPPVVFFAHTQSIRPFEICAVIRHLCSFTPQKERRGGKKTRQQSLLKSPFPLFCKRTLTRVEEER